MNSLELSWYVKQIELEFFWVNLLVFIEYWIFIVFEIVVVESEKIEKMWGIIECLDQFFFEGISVLVFWIYVECLMNFYYKYLFCLVEEEEVEENIQLSIYGIILYKVMENLLCEFMEQ